MGHLFGIFFLLFLLVGCAKYKPQDFDVPMGRKQKKSNIVVAKRVLSEEECRKYFDNRCEKDYIVIY